MQIHQHKPLSYHLSVVCFILALVVLPIMQGIERGSLAQTRVVSGPEMKAFRDGRELLEEEKWARAAERFNDYIADYPNDENVDAALYWLAFALKKQD